MTQEAKRSASGTQTEPAAVTAPSPNQAEHSIFSSEFRRVLVLQLAFGVSFSSFLLLPKFLRTELQASATEIGWVAGTSLVGAALASPFVGLVARRMKRQSLLSLALVLEGSAALLFTLVDRVGPLLFLLRVMQGLAFVVVFNCTATLAAEQLPPSKLAKGLGYLGLSMLCTNALAPAVTEPLADAYGWDLTFGISGVIALSALALVKGARKNELTGLPAQAPIEKRPGVTAVHYGSFVMGAGLGTMFTYVQPFALEQGASKVGEFFFGYVIAAVSVRVFFGGVADRMGPARVAALSLALYAAVVSFTSQLTPSLLIPLGAALGVSHGFIYPALSASGISRTPVKSRPMFMGWFTCAFNAGFALAVLVLGPIADSVGFAPVFLASGLLLATGVAPLGWVHRSDRRLSLKRLAVASQP